MGGRRLLAKSLALFMALGVACSTPGHLRPSPSGPLPSDAAGSGHPRSSVTDQWVTYHADVSRSGSIRGPSLAGIRPAWVSPELDGDVYAEPLVFDGNVIAVTENDSVYLIDGATGKIVRRTNLGTPVAGSTLPCGNISPTSGITATPVVDPSTGVLYVVAFLAPGRHEMFAVRARTGEILWHRPVDPPGMDPLSQQLRSALTLANERVYATFGGLFGDCGAYHGWVVGVDADEGRNLLAYRVPTRNAGGIWAPSGPAVDGAGDLYVATGNSFSDEGFDLGNSVIKLSPELEPLGFFAPEDWAQLNADDLDLGSVGPAVLPDGRVFQIGKGGVGYLLDGADLGGIGGELDAHDVCSAAFGGMAHTGNRVYVPCTDGVVALSILEDGRSFSERWRSSGFDAGPPVVAGGLVWTVDLSDGALVGLDEANGTEVVRREIGDVSHFASPSSASGCLFVPTVRTITAFCG